MLDAASPWAPLLPSARRVTLEVLLHGPLARSELADRLGLSTASLTRLTKPLMDAGLLREADTPSLRGGGRPLQPLDVDPDVQRFIGIKLAGFRAYGVLTNLRADILGSAAVEITDQSPDAVVARIAELVAELDDRARPVAAIGIGIGGVVRDFSRVQRAVFLHWGEIDLGAAVTAATDRPTVVSNDVDALLEAEHWFGDGRDVESFAVLTIGAGVGGGLVIHDRLVSGPDSGLGLLGHFPVDPLGPACPEGHRGCVKALLTTDAIQSQAALTLDRPVTYDEVLDLAEAGNAVADQIVGRAAHAFGTLIAAVANIAQPERIILTGEGIRLAQVAEARVRAAIAQSRHAEASPIDLRFINDDPTLWARGAAAVAIQRTVLVALPSRTN
ncbi:ROK family transcriptional regulator [Actinokineospora sp. UTMC 2448]|uniref:ROK family transcriptional regulator n=1 Tax=Actinokineospora sp. UTMC 2448 TaxID=2268449 RepID=UPI002164108D|nr:ROK family transcriptional regulator [Actinokineospora sp. UTMC 2448]UVS79486.1 N-acetylglucosamine repressor [Actinokineospora sp. UTMC 2448]